MTRPSILADWPADGRRRYGQEVIRFRNRLEETGLFTDEALADLLDRHPRDRRDFCTMRKNPPPGETWIAGEANDLTGAEIVQAVRTGALWASCRGAMATDRVYKPVFNRLMREFAEAAGTPVLTATASVLISGPAMGIFFHCDPAETMLWHVRGTKTINIYPRTDAYIPETALEAILLKENLSDAPWRDEMAAGATPVTLSPGDSVCWPLHGPHNVLNGPAMNVSISIEYTTPASAMTNGVFYTNGILRRRLGLKPTSRGTPVALRPAYWLAAKALRTLVPPRFNAETAHPRQFDIDLGAPDNIRWRPGCGPQTFSRAA